MERISNFIDNSVASDEKTLLWKQRKSFASSVNGKWFLVPLECEHSLFRLIQMRRRSVPAIKNSEFRSLLTKNINQFKQEYVVCYETFNLNPF